MIPKTKSPIEQFFILWLYFLGISKSFSLFGKLMLKLNILDDSIYYGMEVDFMCRHGLLFVLSSKLLLFVLNSKHNCLIKLEMKAAGNQQLIYCCPLNRLW